MIHVREVGAVGFVDIVICFEEGYIAVYRGSSKHRVGWAALQVDGG